MKFTAIIFVIIAQITHASAQVTKISIIVGMANGLNTMSIKNKKVADGLQIPSIYELPRDFPLVFGISLSKEYEKSIIVISFRHTNTKFSNSFDNFIDTNLVLAYTSNEYSINTTELSLELGKKINIEQIANLYPFIGLSLNYNNYASYTQWASISIKNNGLMGIKNNVSENFEPFISMGGLCGIYIRPSVKKLKRFVLFSYINYQFNGGIKIEQSSELLNVFQNKSEVYKSTFSIRPIYYVLGLKYDFIWKEARKLKFK